MIDTVTIRIPYTLCRINEPDIFTPPANLLGKYKHCVLQRPASLYMPNVTIASYFNHDLFTTLTELFITFSAPKLIFDNNLQEVSNKDFSEVIEKLHEVLKVVGIEISQDVLKKGKIKNIHFSKNILLTNTTSLMAIKTLSQGNYRRLKKTVRDYSNNGKKLAFTSKYYEICFYDKSKEVMAEYKKIEPGERKVMRKDVVNAIKGKQVLRMEVRLNSINKIKNLFFNYNILKNSYDLKSEFMRRDIYFKDIFNDSISRKVCLGYFRMIKSTVNIEKESNFTDLIKYILEDKTLKVGKCFSTIGALCVREMIGREAVQNRSIKKLREVEKVMLAIKSLLSIDSIILREFETKLKDFILFTNISSIKSSKKPKNFLTFDSVDEFGEKLLNPKPEIKSSQNLASEGCINDDEDSFFDEGSKIDEPYYKGYNSKNNNFDDILEI